MWLTNSCKRCNPKHQVQKCIKWNFSLVVSFESVSLKPLHMKSSSSFTAGVNPCGERRGWYQEARQTSRRLKVSCLILVCCHTEAFIPDYLQLPSSQLTSHKNTSWHNRQTDVPTRPSNAALTVSEDKQGFSSVLFPACVKRLDSILCSLQHEFSPQGGKSDCAWDFFIVSSQTETLYYKLFCSRNVTLLSFQMDSNAPTLRDEKNNKVLSLGSGVLYLKALCSLCSNRSFSSFMQNRFSIMFGFINKVFMSVCVIRRWKKKEKKALLLD